MKKKIEEFLIDNSKDKPVGEKYSYSEVCELISKYKTQSTGQESSTPVSGVEWANISGKRYLLVDDEMYYSMLIDQYMDGDFEADAMNGGYRILISKKESAYFVSNAMDGGGNNQKELFANSKVILLSPINILTPSASLPVRGETAEVKALIESAKNVIENMFWLYTAGNGRRMSIEDSTGEKCWIVPDDAIEILKATLAAYKESRPSLPISSDIVERMREMNPYQKGVEYDNRNNEALPYSIWLEVVTTLKQLLAERGEKEKGNERIDRMLNKRSDERAANGGLCAGQRTIRCDKTINFDGHIYFSLQLHYHQRQRVWVEYADGNYKCKVNVYDNNSAYRRLICTIDDSGAEQI